MQEHLLSGKSFTMSKEYSTELMLQAIVDMRCYGILDEGSRPDGEVIPSAEFVDQFVNALSLQKAGNLLCVFLRDEDVPLKYREDMSKTLISVLGRMVPVNGDIPYEEATKQKVDNILLYAWIISLCKPYNRIIFLEGDGR